MFRPPLRLFRQLLALSPLTHILRELRILLFPQYSWNSHMCFSRRGLYRSLCFEGFSLNLYLSKSSTSSVKLSRTIALHPGQFISLLSVSLLHLGLDSLVAFSVICGLFPHTPAFCTRLWAPWVQEWCHIIPWVPVPGTVSGSISNCLWNRSLVSQLQNDGDGLSWEVMGEDEGRQSKPAFSFKGE